MNPVRQRLKIVMPAYLGTMLEWYDFSIFAFFSPVLSRLFFPSDNPWASYLSVYAVFAVGFLVRPLGALVFGHFGDRIGRKKVLILSMMLISLSTVAMGLLPTYDQIGLLAPVLLVLLRLLQGFCVGGETTGAASFVLESLPERSRGLLGSLVWSAAGVGMLLSSFVCTLLTWHLDTAQLSAFGWRIPFLFGLISGVPAYYFRRKLPDSNLFYRARQEGTIARNTTFAILKQNHKPIAVLIGLYALSAMITYLIFVFMPFYAETVLGIAPGAANLVTTIAIAAVTFLMPLAGHLSDRIGRKPCLIAGALGFAMCSAPLYAMMIWQRSLNSLIVAETLFAVFATLYQGALTSSAQEATQTSVRYTVTAVSYHVSYALFGGTAPFMVTLLSGMTQTRIIPGLYLIFGSLLALTAIRQLRETAKSELI